MTVVISAGIFLVIIAYEVPGLVKNKEWRELAAFSGLMLLAMGLSFAMTLGLPVPNPNKGLEMIFNPFTDILHKVLSK